MQKVHNSKRRTEKLIFFILVSLNIIEKLCFCSVTYRVVSVGGDDLSDSLPQIVSSNGTSFSNSSSQGQGVQATALLTNPVNGKP